QWEGRVVRAEGAIDPVTRMLHVIARIDDPFAREDPSRAAVPAGLYVQARIEGRELPAAFVVPRESLRDDHTILVVVDGKLRERTVKVERVLGDEAIVTDGLADGDLVCISNPRIVADGMVVRVERPEGAR
ncbi:efflux RND transporter periplasmic adaptor subunit, partial [bacterium]|nr:efflux RND transporter periplasmic adaptor subunit [bacterium]